MRERDSCSEMMVRRERSSHDSWEGFIQIGGMRGHRIRIFRSQSFSGERGRELVAIRGSKDVKMSGNIRDGV